LWVLRVVVAVVVYVVEAVGIVVGRVTAGVFVELVGVAEV
jgi:hypothetical protein